VDETRSQHALLEGGWRSAQEFGNCLVVDAGREERKDLSKSHG
jgi:hypothetical protein